MITVVCWKWRPGDGCRHLDKKNGFSPKHVHILHSALKRNSTVPFRFVCVTDDRGGLDNGAEVVNIERHFPHMKGFEFGCHRRLRAFDQATALAIFGSRFISIDLDVVVTGNIDHILSFQDDFRVWQDKFRRRTPYCGAMWGMRAGSRQRVWDSFTERPHFYAEQAKGLKYTGTDQAHMSLVLGIEQVWSVGDGVYNFNTRIRRSVRATWWVNGEERTQWSDGTLPDNACMVFFNGKYDPSQKKLQEDYPWIKKHWR